VFRQAVTAEFRNQWIVLYSWGALAVSIYAFFHLGPWRNPDFDFNFFHFVGSLIFLDFALWGLVGWRDSNRAVLANNSTFPDRMILGDIDTGQIYQFCP